MERIKSSIPLVIWLVWGFGLFIANLDRFYSATPYWIRLFGALLAFTCMVIGNIKYDKNKKGLISK